MQTKRLLFIILLFIGYNSFAQKQCGCASNPELKEKISCGAIIFHNKARLFRQYNCDSSWLVFQYKGHKKILSNSGNELVDLTGRLGYGYAAEYRNTFLIQNNVISGCCDPPEFIVFDKQTGVLKENLGSLIFYSDDPKYPIIAYLGNLNYIVLLNIDSKKTYRINLPKGRIRQSMSITGETFPEHLFNTNTKGNKLIIKYNYLTPTDTSKSTESKLIFDMKGK